MFAGVPRNRLSLRTPRRHSPSQFSIHQPPRCVRTLFAPFLETPARRPFQRFTIPLSERSCCLIRRLEEVEQRPVRILGLSDVIVRQNEFSQVFTVERRGWTHSGVAKSIGLRICI